MAYCLTNLIQGAVGRLVSGAYVRTTATGGSTTTFVDTKFEDRWDDDSFKDGTCIVVRDTGGVAPEGQFARISGYTASTFTGTVDTALTVAIASGDELMIVQPLYPLVELRRLANCALQNLGGIQKWDESLTTVASQLEYALPTAFKFRAPSRVYVQTDTTYDAWKEIFDWRVQPAAPGSSAALILNTSRDGGYKIGLWGIDTHPTVYAYDDPIDESIIPVLAELMLASSIYEYIGVTDDNRNAANKVLADLEEAKKRWPIPLPSKSGRGLLWSTDMPSDDLR